MPYITNISIFLPNGPPHGLPESYRILVAIELALKDAGFDGGVSGHDIPGMLAQASMQYPFLAGQLNGHQAKLAADLVQITCNNRGNSPDAVKANNYPHARYARLDGDWAGVSETPQAFIATLTQTCNSLLSDLQTHKATLGIQI